MKSAISVISGLSILMLALALGYNVFHRSKIIIFQERTSTTVSLLSDVTDPKFKLPEVNEILRQGNMATINGSSMWNGYTFRASTLSDVDLNRVNEIRLESRNPWLSNEFERAKEISQFTVDASKIMNQLKPDSGRSSSSIIQPMNRELNRLHKDPSEFKTLIIFSDLMENTSQFTFYRNTDLNSFLSQGDLALSGKESLNGIKIYLIYQPIDVMDSDRYMKISEVFMKYFEARGAIVIRRANLID